MPRYTLGNATMKQTILLIAVSATLAACSAQESEAVAAVEAEAGASTHVLADLGGKPEGPIYTKVAGETVALSGYDAVSYFGDGAPVKGSEAFVVRYQGYDYHFASSANAAMFEADPAKYAPQYGGYCAWAIGANDALAPGDPQVYKIVDGKLYLNFSKAVAEKWNKDIPGFIAKGDTNYPTHSPEEHYATN